MNGPPSIYQNLNQRPPPLTDNVDTIISVFLFGLFPGIATFVGVAGAAAAATGIGALIVIGIGLIALISEAIRERVRADQERKRQCDKWKEWCSWGKDIFDHYGFL